MSISTKLQQFKSTTRISLKDKFIGDQGASQLASFLQHHKGATCLELKSNDISSQGLIPIFESLLQSSSQTLKQISIEFNDLSNDYVQWHDTLSALIQSCVKLERLNLSNNNISSEGFLKIAPAISASRSLKLLELKYNKIGNDAVEQFVRSLKTQANSVLLYVEIVGNSKIKKQTLNGLDMILSKNRTKNPISKQKLMGIPGQADVSVEVDRTHSVNANRSSSFAEQIPYAEMTRYMQDILDQNRTQISENKIRLEKQLVDLQKRQRVDAADLNELERRCNEMVIVNRNLKFELDRTLGEYQQIERDDEAHLRAHEEKIKETTREVQELQQKYEQIENRMNKEHELKMKEIVRDWEHRLRSIEQKIRNTENQSKLMQGQIRKCMDKRQRLRIEMVDEENGVRSRVQDEETHRFNFKAKDLQSRLRIAESNRDGYIRRNQQLIYELEKSNTQNAKQIEELLQQLADLKDKDSEFNVKSKDFFSKNQKVKADIQMKQLTLDKLEEQINRLDKQIEAKRAAGDDEHAKLREAHEAATEVREAEKQSRIDRLNQAQNSLRLAQLENGKLRQEYALLAQKLQVSLNQAVHKVFQENSLY